MTKRRAIDLSQSKALFMTHFEKYKPVEDLLFAPYDLSEWNPKAIAEYLDLMTP